jgi:hypothetical protein
MGKVDAAMTDEEIERVARLICTNLGLDPDESVGGGVYDCDTPAERAARNTDFVPDVYCFHQRWRTYRWKAAEAIAIAAAIRKGSD